MDFYTERDRVRYFPIIYSATHILVNFNSLLYLQQKNKKKIVINKYVSAENWKSNRKTRYELFPVGS